MESPAVRAKMFVFGWLLVDFEVGTIITTTSTATSALSARTGSHQIVDAIFFCGNGFGRLWPRGFQIHAMRLRMVKIKN